MLQPMPANIDGIHKRLKANSRVPLWEMDQYLDWHAEQMKHKNWRHVASGGIYEVKGVGLQNTSSGECRVEVQYRPIETAGTRVTLHRAIEEFTDGRFEPVREETIWSTA